jgi:tetratricopeptide (TPR) repeat protein
MAGADLGDLNGALALARSELARAPNSADAHGLVGTILGALGRPYEALPFLKRAVTINPADPAMLNNLGAVLSATGRHAAAQQSFEHAIALAPDYPDARQNLAAALTKTGAYALAIPHFETLLTLLPGSAETQNALAKSLCKADRMTEGIAVYQNIIAAYPDYDLAFADYGHALREYGDFDAAVAAYVHAIALAPHTGSYYRYLAETRPSALNDAHVAALQDLLRSDSLSDDDRIEANFALGNVWAAKDEYARSFEHLAIANPLRRRYIDYDERRTLDGFEGIAQTFSRELIAARRGCSDASSVPIFIFGMPRSGTTLIEQILASHPAVFGAGEVVLFPDSINDTSCDGLRELGQRYVKELRTRAPGAARITDKLPLNFRYAGLIHAALPNARMIHAMRNPVDTCISCYSQNFLGDQPWAYDLAEIGRYYRGYARLMAHWRDVLPPNAMLEVQYEDVVDNLEAQARRIVAFCGLEWDDACLRFYETQRPVRTASAAQVRQPIYRRSVNRWQQYGDLLRPLTDVLYAGGAESTPS